MTAMPKSPLTPAQLEILKVMARPMSEKDLRAIKRLIVRYFADKLTEQVDKIWDEKGWKEEDTNRILNTHLRTRYKQPKSEQI